VPRGEEVYVRNWEMEEGRWRGRGCEDRSRARRELSIADLLIFDIFELWRRHPRILSIAERSISAGSGGIDLLSMQDSELAVDLSVVPRGSVYDYRVLLYSIVCFNELCEHLTCN
jgi:hypothetical protein